MEHILDSLVQWSLIRIGIQSIVDADHQIVQLQAESTDLVQTVLTAHLQIIVVLLPLLVAVVVGDGSGGHKDAVVTLIFRVLDLFVANKHHAWFGFWFGSADRRLLMLVLLMMMILVR